MPTKEDLQDEIDELRLALEQTRDAAESEIGELRRGAEGLRAEISALRGALAESERQRRQLQSTLDTLNETQHSLQELYAEKEDRLLGRLADEGARVAATGERWRAAEAQLRGELAERDSTIGELEGKLARKQTMVHTQGVWVTQLRGELSEARSANDIKAAKITRLENQITRHGRELQLAEENRQSILVGTFEQLTSRPGCWLGIAVAVNAAWFLVWSINSIINWWSPCETLLGS